MEALGGEYGIKSRHDNEQGSNFWFSIPYRPDTTAVNEVAVRSLSVANNTISLTAPTINTNSSSKDVFRALNVLLVDDALSILKMTTMVLKRHG